MHRKEEKMKAFDSTDTVAFAEGNTAVRIIDQTLLPGEVKLIDISKREELYEAIKKLRVRGAPAIGVFAAMALSVLSRSIREKDKDAFLLELQKEADYLNSSRPTAVNLSWALSEMMKEAKASETDDVSAIIERLYEHAVKIRDDEEVIEKKIGELGAPLIKDGYGVLTHCNAGRLACLKYGTATAPMYIAHENGVNFRAYCDETRPLLQGARLTALELSDAGIDTTLNCDNMSSSLMKSGKIDIIFVGADRIAANYDTANKIGTSLLAIAAKHYGIPFYVCAPTSTIDESIKTGADIPIEEREPSEVTEMWYEKRMAPENIKVYNPAFDVTDHSLITGVITENGIHYLKG